MKKFLFIALRALGDVILITPAIRAVYESCPDAQCDLLVEEAYFSLFKEEGYIRRVITLPRKKKNVSKTDANEHIGTYLKFLLDIRKEKYDAVFDLFSRGPRSRVITFFSGSRKRLGFKDRKTILDPIVYSLRLSPPSQITQVYDKVLYMVGRLGYRTKESRPHLTATEENFMQAREVLKSNEVSEPFNYITVFPGSGNPNKNWPVENFQELILKIIQHGFTVIVLGGPLDQKPLNKMKGLFSLRNPKIHFVQIFDLPTLKGILALSKGAISNDSGPAHLAQSLGIKTLVLFGPFDHTSYIPFNGEYVRSGYFCSPCQTFSNICPDNQCMKKLSVEDVYRKFHSMKYFTNN